MDQNENNENQDDSFFDIETSKNVKDTTVQRMKEFCYYLTEKIEKNLNFYLAVLEERTTPEKPNTNPIKAISSVTTPIPYIGKGISSALKEGEIYILNKIDQKHSRTLAELVFYFSDNKESIRQMLIQSSSELFYSFEDQFMKLTCDGGPRRAMQKLAKDAANRIFTHFLKTRLNAEISKDDFTKGAIFGSSVKNNLGIKAGRSLDNDKHTWKTSDIFTKVGLYFEDINEYYTNAKTRNHKYGFRRSFSWEDLQEVREKWTRDNPSSMPDYNLRKQDLIALFSEVKEYIISKNVDEDARLDREKKHHEEMDDQQTKHKELVRTFNEKFEEVLDQISKNYEEIKTSRQQGQQTVKIIKEERNEINGKLTAIHCDVVETKEGQKVLQQTTEDIKSEICVIKSKQDEMATSTSQVQKITLNDLVEVKKVTKVINETKESLEKNGSDVERKVRKEVKRGLKKIFK